ncbi:MAG: VCBS repeat-containing protein [Deltaproteobacteria bacterium]|nr:VCBS repeat-containing protein [Nannocystaceae bacterium]
MTFVGAPVRSQIASSSALVRRAGACALLGGAMLVGCFDPSDPPGAATEAADSTTATSSPSSSTASGTTMGTSATESTSGADGPTSTSEPIDTSDTTITGADESSTGEPSNCPGGAPTAGEAPYVLTTVIAAQDTDDVDIGDINGDGHLDLISLSRIDTSVESFWGDGAGAFESDGVTMLGMQGYPDTVRLGAIADDTVDLFVHMEGPVELWVVRGDGAGNWPSPQVYDLTYVRAIDMADLNGDGVLDLAYVGASNLEVRLGAANETYEASAAYGENYGNVVRAADISGDGFLDLLTAGYGATELEIYSGYGEGSFAAELTLVTGSPIAGIDVGHFDADEHLDMVLTTAEDLRVFYGEARGGISSTPGTIIEGALGRVRVADIDADGLDDLVTHASAAVEIRFSVGDRTFTAATPFACSTFLRNLEIGDLNEDCVPDLVGPMGPGEDLCVLLSDRD